LSLRNLANGKMTRLGIKKKKPKEKKKKRQPKRIKKIFD
jgi:hypothetical protein